MKLNCPTIDYIPNLWEYWHYNLPDRTKYLEFNKNDLPDTLYFCNFLSNNNILNNNISNDSTQNKIQILGRIGSPSADGEVYHIRYYYKKDNNNEEKTIDFAMKIMPRIDEYSEAKNSNEIKTALLASQIPEYFPVVFGYGSCDNANYYLSSSGECSSFITKAIEYRYFNKILNIIGDDIRKRKYIENDYRNGMSLEAIALKYGIDMKRENMIQVEFLISELANGDLGNWMWIWMWNDHSIDELKQVISGIIKGIYYLNVYVKKVHPDLHPGNILLIANNNNNNNNIKVLIHDFGRSYSISEETLGSTIISFCQEFLASLGNSAISERNFKVPNNIILSITNILSYVTHNNITSDNITFTFEYILSLI